MGCLQRFVKRVKGLFLAPGQTPLDPVILGIIFFATLADSMTITMPSSYLPRMMREFGIAEKEIGNYVGAVASSLYIGSTFGSFLLGWLCDKIGRKRSLLISTLLMFVATMLFGFSKSFAWAVTVRLFQGFFGGCSVALKATVCALCDDTNRGFGMVVFLTSFQIGKMIGPAVGGYLVLPVKSYPETFSKGSFFDEFPFLLPILINCAILAISFALIAIRVPETLKKDAANEKTALVDNGQVEAGPSKRQLPYDACIARESNTVLSVRRQSGNKILEGEIDGKRAISYFQLSNESNFVRSSQQEVSCCKRLKESSLWQLLSIKTVRISLSLYAIFSFIAVGFDEIFPIFADSSRRYGGLAFTSGQIGTAILVAAIPVTLLMGVVARLEHKFGAKKLFIFAACVHLFEWPLFPFIGMVPPRFVWYALVPAMFCLRFTVVIGFLAVNVVLNNSMDPKYIGMVNGLGMTASSFCRSMSPTVLGSLYSWSLKNEGSMRFPFNHAFSFVATGFVALLMLFIAVCLPDKTKETTFVTEENDSSSSNKHEESEPSTTV